MPVTPGRRAGHKPVPKNEIGVPRLVRVPDPLWTKVQKHAKKNDLSLSEVVRQALAAYVGK